MPDKITPAVEAVALIRDGDTLANAGFVGNGTPDELLAALERRFLTTGAPRDLTLLFAAGQGDGKARGLNRVGHEGLLDLGGEEWLLYPTLPIHVAFVRGTTADPEGNITMERESLVLDGLPMAMAAKNSGGIVIAQVERVAASGTLHPRAVQIPGILVDHVVVASPENHLQTYATAYNPAFSAELRVPASAVPRLPLDARKVIARRAALELAPGMIVNLGIGVPEGVAGVAHEERVLDRVTLTTEPGVLRLAEAGPVLVEVAPGVDVERDVLGQMGFRPRVPEGGPARMDGRIFREEAMGIDLPDERTAQIVECVQKASPYDA